MAVPFYDADDIKPNRGYRRTLHGGYGLPAAQTVGDGFIDLGPGYTHRPLCSETDPDLFFPEKGEQHHAIAARRVCNLCPAKDECRQHGEHEPFGIWGATTVRDRQRHRTSPAPSNLDDMQVLGHINGIAHHERHRPVDHIDYPAMTAAGRRKIISTLIGHPDWTASSIAEALAISEAVINADLEDIGLDYHPPTPPAAPTFNPQPRALTFDDRGKFTSSGKPHTTILLEAYGNAPTDGLTGPEAGRLAGLDHAAVSKRMTDLKKRKHIRPLLNEHDMPIQRAHATVYVITDLGRRTLS